jgi:hypothetical protein
LKNTLREDALKHLLSAASMLAGTFKLVVTEDGRHALEIQHSGEEISHDDIGDVIRDVEIAKQHLDMLSERQGEAELVQAQQRFKRKRGNDAI